MALGLGSNVGASETALCWAIGKLRHFLASSFGAVRVASLYRSAPVSPIAQPDFLNTALLAMPRTERGPRAELGPRRILSFAKSLEIAAGRRPGPRFGPRPLDVDLLLWGDLVVDDPDLVLPHPRLGERRFVLAPLAELAPELRVPPAGRSVAELLAELLTGLGEDQRVERLEWREPPCFSRSPPTARGVG